MTRRASARSAALRRAQEAKAERDAASRRREAQIESALADYYLATSLAEGTREAARKRTAATLAEAERAAAVHDEAAADAVRRLRDLLGGNTEVAQLCGLAPGAVRDLLAASRAEDQHGSQP